MFRDYIDGTEGRSDASLSAAEHIDVLTFCRVRDFQSLTPHQQRVLLTVHQKLTDFETENADILDTPLTSYSVNGVSMSFGDKVKVIGGVTIPSDLYSLLCTSGLCYPAV